MGCTRGEHKTLQLADGSQVLLHKAGALNIAFSSVERRIRLQDLITTAKGSVSCKPHTAPQGFAPSHR